jgi:predicted acyl esterase
MWFLTVRASLRLIPQQGGILLHLRGNIRGFMGAGSEFKYLRCITGRHDLPFYYDEEVDVQRSFLDAFLKGKDDRGWTEHGKVSKVNMVSRRGEPKYNNAEDERRVFPRREESEWPLSGTEYRKFFLRRDQQLSSVSGEEKTGSVSYKAPQ